ncbi:hypothetical protein BCR34DRAFT_620235 [Clohesyomyces aquaticus]|uniref:DUF7029 domain-containing protein n=1 Tax=Clohesyomyces aquaticus TaxID=1231657 RepID=A0A1Y1Y817_9PLEO|nr:hypothetical protein BCR34DRAFT_620235 [Clohesyomyces aquaticus]
MRFTRAIPAFASTVAAPTAYYLYSGHNTTKGASYSLVGTQGPLKVCSAATVTVYETTYGPKIPAAGSKASPSAKDPKHLVLKYVGGKTQLYYAESGKTDADNDFTKPSKTLCFGIINLLFKAPAVVLEHSSYVAKMEYRDDQLSIEFSSASSCEFAMTSWTKGMIIVSSSTTCKNFSDDDQCYFKVVELVKPKDGKTIILTVTPIAQDECMEGGEVGNVQAAQRREVTAGLDSDELTNIACRVALQCRNLDKRVIKKLIGFVKNKILAPAVTTLRTAVNVAGTITQGAVQLVTAGTISAKAEAKMVESPWGPAIVIAAYCTESKLKADQGVEREGYLNIFCLGCGAEGNVELAFTATWSVTQGITKGELEAWADLKAALKVGVDAQIKLNREWKKNLFQIGLPGLSFCVITIGPQVRVDSRVALEAEAEGRILAGAELNWNRAYAKIDLTDLSKSVKKNFDPQFRPTFEAEGSIFVGAELGLPIGLHFGISISTWKKTVGLINEPMIKGIAKAAAKVELVGGRISAGFTPTEGCTGIHANLSWQNRLYGNVADVKEFDILDTGYKTIRSACIPIGAQPQPRQAIDAPKPVNARQTANTIDLPEGVIEITDSVKNDTDLVNYKIEDIPTVAYTRTDGYEFTKLLADGGEYNILFCSNGNLYVKKPDIAAGIGYGEPFAYSDNSIIGDGAGRYLDFHKDAMSAAGVSRLRLGDEENPVVGTSAVALMAFCMYKDGQAPKVFVVRDLEAGIAVLESGDVKYSVTGGDVNKCYPLMVKEDPEPQTAWKQFGDSLLVDPDGLEFPLETPVV